jgi:hypothetical protein
VAIIISAKEEKRAFSGYDDALSVAPPPPPGPPPLQLPRTPLRLRRIARNKVWDAWLVASGL